MDFAEKLEHIKAISHTMSADEWRFWGKIDIRTDAECWPWTAALSNTGRAVFATDAGAVPAARYMWFLETGAMPASGLVIRHTCDNPACVNPAHLCIGTHTDNMRDMKVRGRAIHMPHVDEDIKRVAIAAYRAGKGTQMQVAIEHGMSIRALQRALKQHSKS